MKKSRIKQPGFVAVELLLSLSILALLATGIAYVALYAAASSLIAGQHSRAVLLAEEGLEAVRAIRDNNFADITEGDYGIGLENNNWEFLEGSDVREGFTRTIHISELQTNVSYITSTVEWFDIRDNPHSVTLATALSNWKN